MALRLVCLAVVVLSILQVERAWATSCGPISFDTAQEGAEAIFVGTVVEARGVDATVEVRRIYKGTVGARATVRSTYRLGSVWVVGKEYLFFTKMSDGGVVAPFCLGTHRTDYHPESTKKDWVSRLGPGTAPAGDAKGCDACGLGGGNPSRAPIGLAGLAVLALTIRRSGGARLVASAAD